MTPEKWARFSKCDQVLNVMSELKLLENLVAKDLKEAATESFYRCIDLIDLMKTDIRWASGLKEICRSKESLAQTILEDPSVSEIKTFEQTFLQLNAEAFGILEL